MKTPEQVLDEVEGENTSFIETTSDYNEYVVYPAMKRYAQQFIDNVNEATGLSAEQIDMMAKMTPLPKDRFTWHEKGTNQ